MAMGQSAVGDLSISTSSCRTHPASSQSRLDDIQRQMASLPRTEAEQLEQQAMRRAGSGPSSTQYSRSRPSSPSPFSRPLATPDPPVAAPRMHYGRVWLGPVLQYGRAPAGQPGCARNALRVIGIHRELAVRGNIHCELVVRGVNAGLGLGWVAGIVWAANILTSMGLCCCQHTVQRLCTQNALWAHAGRPAKQWSFGGGLIELGPAFYTQMLLFGPRRTWPPRKLSLRTPSRWGMLVQLSVQGLGRPPSAPHLFQGDLILGPSLLAARAPSLIDLEIGYIDQLQGCMTSQDSVPLGREEKEDAAREMLTGFKKDLTMALPCFQSLVTLDLGQPAARDPVREEEARPLCGEWFAACPSLKKITFFNGAHCRIAE
ncbi:hypothetical protein FB45DRAFT_859223 [Roridomyces roridus]|uniref:Uncharacterized protein n=1 Tax=Roridomyces roridus TaxID=1738132 RepID=A0AAD7CJL6_9AGAR|nr:hypothetical protein FB45DRAFT_859223 [Roridomyces roridus]